MKLPLAKKSEPGNSSTAFGRHQTELTAYYHREILGGARRGMEEHDVEIRIMFFIIMLQNVELD